eukprot:SAG31_NODE_4045_length_3640_cov_3.520474_3_plen_597_part_00
MTGSTPPIGTAGGAATPTPVKPTAAELTAFYTSFDKRKYNTFWADVGQEMSKTPLGNSDFDPKNRISVAALRRKLIALPIQIQDIDLSKFKEDGSDYDSFLTAHGLAMMERFQEELASDEDSVTQKTEMTASMKAGTEMTDSEVQKLVKGKAQSWADYAKAVSQGNYQAVLAYLGQDNEWSKLLTRALLTFESLGTVKAGKNDATRQQYNSVMLNATALRGTFIRNSILPQHFSEETEQWPLRTGQKALGYSTAFWANSLEDFSTKFEQGVSELLQLKSAAQLKTASPSSMIDAMECIMALWAATLGPSVGDSAGTAIKGIIATWEHKDPGCAKWSDFYPGQPPGVLSVVRHIILPRLFRWAIAMWASLISANAIPESLATALTPMKMKTEFGGDVYDVYRQNAVRAGQLPATKRASGTNDVAPGGKQKKAKKECSFCGKKGHDHESCWELQSARNAAQGGQATGKGGKGQGKSKRGRRGGRPQTPQTPPNWDWNMSPPSMDWNANPQLMTGMGGFGGAYFTSPPFTPQQPAQWGSAWPKACHNCGDHSHLIKDCPHPPRLKGGSKGKGKGKSKSEPVIQFLQDVTGGAAATAPSP